LTDIKRFPQFATQNPICPLRVCLENCVHEELAHLNTVYWGAACIIIGCCMTTDCCGMSMVGCGTKYTTGFGSSLGSIFTARVFLTFGFF